MTNSQQLRSHVERDQHRRSNDHIFKYHVVEPVLRERRVRFCHRFVLQVASSIMDRAHARAGKVLRRGLVNCDLDQREGSRV